MDVPVVEGRNEAIAAPGNRHQVAGAVLAIAKGLSHQGNLCSEIALIDDKACPNTSEQFVLGDDLARAFNQNGQEIERTSADVNGCISLEQEVRRGRRQNGPNQIRAVTRRGASTFGAQRSAP